MEVADPDSRRSRSRRRRRRGGVVAPQAGGVPARHSVHSMNRSACVNASVCVCVCVEGDERKMAGLNR